MESLEQLGPAERICIARPTHEGLDLNIAPETLPPSGVTLEQCPAPAAGSQRAVATRRFDYVRMRAHDASRPRGNYSCKSSTAMTLVRARPRVCPAVWTHSRPFPGDP